MISRCSSPWGCSTHTQPISILFQLRAPFRVSVVCFQGSNLQLSFKITLGPLAPVAGKLEVPENLQALWAALPEPQSLADFCIWTNSDRIFTLELPCRIRQRPPSSGLCLTSHLCLVCSRLLSCFSCSFLDFYGSTSFIIHVHIALVKVYFWKFQSKP